MTSPTHKTCGTAMAVAATEAARLPLAAQSVIVGVAWLSSGTVRLKHKRLRLRLTLSPDIDCLLPHWMHIGHREETHWPFTALLVAIAVTAGVEYLSPELAPLVGAGVLIGWVTHHLADACTHHGDPLLGPFWRRSIHLLPEHLRFYTGTPDRERGRCTRCKRYERLCRCGRAERRLRFVVAAGLVVVITQHFV